MTSAALRSAHNRTVTPSGVALLMTPMVYPPANAAKIAAMSEKIPAMPSPFDDDIIGSRRPSDRAIERGEIAPPFEPVGTDLTNRPRRLLGERQGTEPAPQTEQMPVVPVTGAEPDEEWRRLRQRLQRVEQLRVIQEALHHAREGVRTLRRVLREDERH